MLRLLKVFFDIDKKITLLFFLSILIVILFEFVGLNLEPYGSFFKPLSSILLQLSVAFIASYIFYFIVVKMKEFHREKIFANIISEKINLIYESNFILIKNLTKQENINPIVKNKNYKKFTEILSKIKSANSESLLFGKTLIIRNELLEEIESSITYTKRLIHEIYVLTTFDEKLIGYLFKVESSSLIKKIISILHNPDFKESNLSYLSRELLDYLHNILYTKEYIDRNYKRYR